MTKKELNKIDNEKLLDVIRAAGLDVQDQKAYLKCTFGGNDAARIYVSKTKKVSRCDAAGFTLARDGVLQISRDEAKEQRLGNVQAQLDFSQSEDIVLEALGKLCEALKTVPKPEPKAKKERKPRAKKTETTEAAAPETTDTPETEVVAARPTDEERRKLVKQAAEAARQAAANA